MVLEIAKRISKSTNQNSNREHPSQATHSIPTIRRYRQYAAANDSNHHFEYLPDHFYDGGEHNEYYGDREWILAKLRRVASHQQRAQIAKEYGTIFKAEYDSENIDFRKNGKARFVANKWLLKQTR